MNPESSEFDHGKSNIFYGNFSDVRIASLVDTHSNFLTKNRLSTNLPCLSLKLPTKTFDLSWPNPEHSDVNGIQTLYYKWSYNFPIFRWRVLSCIIFGSLHSEMMRTSAKWPNIADNTGIICGKNLQLDYLHSLILQVPCKHKRNMLVSHKGL